MPVWLLRLVPVMGSAAVLAVMFPVASQTLDLDNTEEILPTLEQIQPVSEKTTPQRKNGRGTATNIVLSQGTNRGDGVCQIYTGRVGSMTGDSLIFESDLKKHDSLDKARSAVPSGNGSVQCDSGKHFYVWKSSFDKGEIRSSSTAPQQS